MPGGAIAHLDEHVKGDKDGEAPPPQVASLPSMASQQYINEWTAFEPNDDEMVPRTMRDRFGDAFYNLWYDPGRSAIGERQHPMPPKNMFGWLTKNVFPLKPETYVDPYLAPNRCPEEYWYNPWRWMNTKRVNPKIPPPVDGRYNDFYHFLAFKNFVRVERDVYMMHLGLLQEMMIRCSIKEGVNAAKNCRHLWNKYFCMSRHEEFTQNLLYMSLTGNVVIRETPYPADWVEQKRKIYDDWLTRTRMRLPGDHY
mmetsp:Transcript_3521/g.10946  ORF Transcript_3521/g.10946 Transcript_3521/m.10946 type:complete len:254 (-) Transcript_3521:84-845(-)|eukprot:CAMPEP_0174851888 /NCGR_PEP_ID=MMETSP1114-20130205/24369_1 /TAXON_ID=312471 /ORGANISM="Neobodo designis, Strain CCAP 1951/1" /LENGTH=253 /DNA_ID=CAMNT_0016086455 /DNA_START=194 /DNA_END=955 /DNA_ORIENTATION=+